jgi:hypothetical protein
MRILALALLAVAARAQIPFPACNPPAAIQSLAPERHTGVNLNDSDRTAKIAKIREVLALSPDDLFLNRWLIELQPKPQTGSLRLIFKKNWPNTRMTRAMCTFTRGRWLGKIRRRPSSLSERRPRRIQDSPGPIWH